MENNTKNITSVSKLTFKDHIIYAKILWNQNGPNLFEIQILDVAKSWSGKYSREFAQQFMEINDESEEEYIKNVQNCLSGEDSTFTVDLKEDLSNANLEWKKKIKGSSAVMLHGRVLLHLDQSISKDFLIDYLLSINKDLSDKLNKSNKNCDTLKSKLNLYVDKVETCIQEKKSLEATLYGKFVQLLNTKKRRIKLLEECLSKYEET